MQYRYQKIAIAFFDDRVTQAKLAHFIKSGIQSFPYITIWRIGEFV